MATKYWTGAAQARAEVKTVQITAYDAATTYTLTTGKKFVSTIAAGSANATVTALVTAWNASEEPELAEITASASTDTVVFTHDTAGVPFTVTGSVSGGAGTIGATGTTTSATGPNFFNAAANWSDGVAPANSDTLWVTDSDDEIKYGLDLSAITGLTIYVLASFTGTIGLPLLNTDADEYVEYRGRYLQISGGTVEIGSGEGDGSGRILLDGGSANALTVRVYSTGAGLDEDLEAVLLKTTHASSVLTVTRGEVGVAVFGGEAATIATLKVGFVGSEDGDSTVRMGLGCTLTTVHQAGGTLVLNSAATTIVKTGGELTINGTGAYTTITVNTGTLFYRSSGTVTTLNVGSDALVDYNGDMRARTVTTANLYAGAAISDRFGTVTWTNPLNLLQASPGQVSLDLRENISLAVAYL